MVRWLRFLFYSVTGTVLNLCFLFEMISSSSKREETAPLVALFTDTDPAAQVLPGARGERRQPWDVTSVRAANSARAANSVWAAGSELSNTCASAAAESHTGLERGPFFPPFLTWTMGSDAHHCPVIIVGS